MSLIIINEIIKIQDIALHIYNYYLIFKHFKNKELTKKRLNLFLNYFKDNPEYYDLIIDFLHLDNPYVKKMIVNDLILEKIIKKHPYVIKYMDDTYKNNEMVIKEACYFNSYYFKYASNELKINIKFILKLLEVNIFVYFFIDEKIRTNNEIYEKIKKINPLLLGLI